MKTQRVFFALGLCVAAFTGVMIFARRGGLRPEPLPFAERLPADTVLYVALPDHAAFFDSVAGSAAWTRAGLGPAGERYRKARERLAEAAGPSAAFVVRKGGRWAAFFRLRAEPKETAGEVDGLHWAARRDVVAVSDSPESARSALAPPFAMIDVEGLANDRLEVCGATRGPFAWLDLRDTPLPARYADIGGIAFTAAFGEEIRVRALGVYYTAARTLAIAEFVHRPRVAIAGPASAAAWSVQMESSTDLWRRVIGALSSEDYRVVEKELDRLAAEFLPKGTVETQVIEKLGPEWGIAWFDAPHPCAVAWTRVPEGSEALLRKAANDFAKLRRDRGLVPFAEAPAEGLALPWIPSDGTVKPAFAVRGGTLYVTTWAPLLDDPAVEAMAARAPGEWHIAGAVRTTSSRALLDAIEKRFGWTAECAKVRALLDRAPWIASAEWRGRYTDAGLRVEATLRP